MFKWLWERLGGGKGAKAQTEEQPSVDTEKIDETQAGSAETDLSDDTKAETTDDVDMEEAVNPEESVNPEAVVPKAATTTKVRPKKANATTAKSKPYRNSASTAAQELPAKKKSNRGTTMASGTPSKAVAARRRGKLDFDQFFPKLVTFAEEQGHWNVPANVKLYSFVQSLRQHVRRIEEWEEETKFKYSEVDREMANELMFALTPAEMLRLEKSGFSLKDEKTSGGRTTRRKASV